MSESTPPGVDADEPLAAVRRRVEGLEVEQFTLTAEVYRHKLAQHQFRSTLDELERALAELALDPPSPPTADRAPEPTANEPAPHTSAAAGAVPQLDVLHRWVEVHIAPLVRKTTTSGEGGGIRWCRTWWHHDDALQRFRALYLAHHELSTSDTDMWWSVYLRDHLDPHLSALTSPYGPFHACSPNRHSPVVTALGHHPLDDGSSGDGGNT